MINGGSSYTSQPTITFSNPETNYTATPLFTEDYENTTVGSAGFTANPWKIIDNNGIITIYLTVCYIYIMKL